MANTNLQLIKYMKETPEVYSESSSAFWTDPHISEYMLKAHLDPDFEGASRKHEFIKQSVDWIAEYCHGGRGKKLLDLGCGPGIYAELLTDLGFCVTGIDFSERSIAYAKQHADSTGREISYYCKNYLELDAFREYDVVILIYCDFGVLSPDIRSALLRKITKALKKDGLLILDGFTRSCLNSFQVKETIQYEASGFWSADPYVVIQRNFLYPETANTLEQYLVLTENDCRCYNLWNQVYTADSLRAELTGAGFQDIHLFDNAAGKPYTGQDTTICAAAINKPAGQDVLS